MLQIHQLSYRVVLHDVVQQVISHGDDAGVRIHAEVEGGLEVSDHRVYDGTLQQRVSWVTDQTWLCPTRQLYDSNTQGGVGHCKPR